MITNPTLIWKSFKQLFPDNAKDVTSFTEHGKDSIVLHFKDYKKALLFTIDISNKTWRLEPYHKKS